MRYGGLLIAVCLLPSSHSRSLCRCIAMKSLKKHSVDCAVRFVRACVYCLKSFRLLLGAIVLLTLGGCASVENVKDQITDRFGNSDSQSETSSGTAGSASAVVKSKKAILLTSIQESLDELGYAPGRTDGNMDPQTEAAIQDFQLDNDLRISGRPSEKLLEAIQEKLAGN